MRKLSVLYVWKILTKSICDITLCDKRTKLSQRNAFLHFSKQKTFGLLFGIFPKTEVYLEINYFQKIVQFQEPHKKNCQKIASGVQHQNDQNVFFYIFEKPKIFRKLFSLSKTFSLSHSCTIFRLFQKPRIFWKHFPGLVVAFCAKLAKINFFVFFKNRGSF